MLIIFATLRAHEVVDDELLGTQEQCRARDESLLVGKRNNARGEDEEEEEEEEEESETCRSVHRGSLLLSGHFATPFRDYQ